MKNYNPFKCNARQVAIYLLALLIISFAGLPAQSQTIDTTRTILPVSGSAFQYKIFKVDSAAIFPTDTPRLKAAWRAVGFKGNSPYFWNGTSWKTFSSASLTKNGIILSGDTSMLGGKVDRYTYIEVPNREINGTLIGHVLFGNNPEAQSFNGIVSPWLTSDVYGASLVGVQKFYTEALHDTARRQYGAAFSTLSVHLFDSTSTRYKAGVKNIRMPSQGIYTVYQIYPPRDSVVWEIGRDGESSEAAHIQVDLGNSYGYNIKTVSDNGSPEYPLNAILSSIDYMRVIDNTRLHKLVGPGWSNLTTRFKTYQTPITGSTYEAGNYVGQHTQITLYGDAYSDIGSATTKTKIQAVFTLDTSIGLKIRPLNLTTNTAKNGIAIWAQGASDYSHFNGYVTIGGNLPLLQNGGQTFTDKLLVTGNMKATGNITAVGNTYAFVTQAYGMAVNIPIAVGTEAGINYTQTDSALVGTIAAYLNPASREGRGMYIRSEMYNGATLPATSNGGFVQIETGINHAFVTRWSRNGNMTVNRNTIITDPYRFYKMFVVNGGTLFSPNATDTMTIVNMPQAWNDSTRFNNMVWDNVTKAVMIGPYVGSGAGGSGANNANAGSGFRWLKPGTQEIKTVFAGIGTLIDSSSNTDGLTFKSDTLVNQTQYRGIKLIDSMVLINNARYWSLSGNQGVSGSQTGSWFGTSATVPIRFRTNNTQRMLLDSTKNQLQIGTPTVDATSGLIVQSLTNANGDGLKVYSLNNAGNVAIGFGQFTPSANYNFSNSTQISFTSTNGTLFGLSAHSNTATALVHVGASATSKSQLRLVSTGALPTGGNILAGNIDAISDDIYYTINTGTAQKKFTLSDATLTSGTTPVATTNGRLTDGLILASSTWTPTITGLSNVSSSSGPSGIYTRVGNNVNYSILVLITPTAGTTNTSFRYTLPISSNITNSPEDLTGTVNIQQGTTYNAGLSVPDDTNDAGNIQFSSVNTSVHVVRITGQYIIH